MEDLNILKPNGEIDEDKLFADIGIKYQPESMEEIEKKIQTGEYKP